MRSLWFFVMIAVFVCQVTGDDDEPYDDTHECQLFRQCKSCTQVEYCLNIFWSIQRSWFKCPPWAPYCNPYSQRCEAKPSEECQKLLPTTKSASTAAGTTPAATTAAGTTKQGG